MKSAWAHFAEKLFDKYWQRSRILLSNPWQIERHAMSQRSFTFVERKLRTPHRSRLSCHKLRFHAQPPTLEFPLKSNSVQSHYFLMLQVRLAICQASFVYESCCMWSFSFHTINLHRISWNPFSFNKILTTERRCNNRSLVLCWIRLYTEPLNNRQSDNLKIPNTCYQTANFFGGITRQLRIWWTFLVQKFFLEKKLSAHKQTKVPIKSS